MKLQVLSMATIEERAKEYAKGRRYTLTAYEAYRAGATEQKAIDIENACKWIKENARDYACATIRCYGDEDEIICDVHQEIVEDFRKEMEEYK